jgi:hypothetical protein
MKRQQAALPIEAERENDFPKCHRTAALRYPLDPRASVTNQRLAEDPGIGRYFAFFLAR